MKIINYIRFARSVRRAWKAQGKPKLVRLGDLDQSGRDALAALSERAA